MNTADLRRLIQTFAPESLQEDWDNSGYNVDLHNENIDKIMVCLDVTPSIILEAEQEGCGAIVSHHPLLFRQIRRVDTDSYVQRVLAMLLQKGISLYCAHTSMDSSSIGINRTLASILGLQGVAPLEMVHVPLYKLSVCVPRTHAAAVRTALMESGAGTLGDYKDCTFSTDGTGTFCPGNAANPFLGIKGILETVEETRIEALVTGENMHAVEAAVRAAHPYEEPALDMVPLTASAPGEDGMGCIGNLEGDVALADFAATVRDKLSSGCVFVTGDLQARVRRVAVCGGSAAELADAASAQGADVLVTGEVKHNNYLESPLPLIVAGHYDTEKCFVPAMVAALQSAGIVVDYKVGVCVPKSMRRPYCIV